MRKKYGFPRSHRLTRGGEMIRVGVQGKRVRTAHLDVRTVASPLLHPRIGFIVPKYGRSAVERNRLKRHLREIVRTHLLAELPSIDVLIRVNSRAYDVPYPMLVDELTQVLGPDSSLL